MQPNRNNLSIKTQLKHGIYRNNHRQPQQIPIPVQPKPERNTVEPPIISTNDKIKRLNVVLTCVNYSDLLVISLRENIKHIEPKYITVVTDINDNLTKKVCEVFGVNCVVTDRFYEDDAVFNKGKGINEGIKSLNNPEWILLTDADIIFPSNFIEDLSKKTFDSSKLYSASRYLCRTYKTYLKYKAENIELEEMDGMNRCMPIGYFQLFSYNHHSLTDKRKIYPEQSNDASWSDMLFGDKFQQKSCIESVKLIHLGIESRNWKGRKTERFIDDDELFKIIDGYMSAPFVKSPRKTKGKDKLAVLTSFFNPANYSNIKHNYEQFRSFMKDSGVDLFTAELVFDDQDFFTEESKNNIHIRGSKENVMWQKERLLNLLLDKLPPEYNNVAWIDCDVLFENKNWVDDINKTLKEYKLVQPFEYVQFNNENGVVDKNCLGVIKYLNNEKELSKLSFDQRCGGSPGLAWAIRREDIKDIKFNDIQIAGGADAVMMLASVGIFDDFYLYNTMNSKWYSQTLIWSVKFSEQINKSVFYIPGSVYHLYHGILNNRKYMSRKDYLVSNDYNPRKDIEINSNGVWEWASDKEDLHKKLKHYFIERHEDDNVVEEIITPFDLNNYFDGIFCINLERRPDRWQKVSEQFNKHNIKVERIVAFDGNWEMVKNEWEPIYNNLARTYGNQFLVNPSEIGFIENSYAYATLCSHIKVIQLAKQKGLKRILVFEDDVLFHKNFDGLIKNIDYYKDWKLLYLGASQYNWSNITIENGYYHPTKTMGGFAYAIDSSIYDEVLLLASKREKSFDNCLGNYNGDDIQAKYKNDCYVMYPNFVIADVRTSDLRESREINEHSEKMKWINNDYDY